MKYRLLLLFFMLFSFVLKAQDNETIIFKYRCVPTSTSDYLIEITRDSFMLKTTDKIPGKNDRIKNVVTSNYNHAFNSKEKATVDSIIKINRLDSPGLYHDRITEWGSLWEVEIHRNSITYNISLPNYNNAGLESLLSFIVCLIPKKERPLYECKKCT